MIVLGLITCIMLRAFTAQAKVVDSFEECKEFFYEGKEPRGMDQNAIKICQTLKNLEGSYYATLYSVHYKIPLYSAYTLDPKCTCDKKRPTYWRIESQLLQEQAISSDYSGTGYDRGHLNPSCFQCGDGRKATFTLTNAAPMIRCFNQKHWKKWESTLRRFLKPKLDRDDNSATAFIVTGTVPDPNVRIPQDHGKVTVPSHIWTAVCYKHKSENSKSLSFGYIERNHEEVPNIRLISVSELNDELSRLYSELSGTVQSIQIFADDCSGDNNKLNEVKDEFKKLTNEPEKQADQMSSGMRNMATKRTFSSDRIPKKKPHTLF